MSDFGSDKLALGKGGLTAIVSDVLVDCTGCGRKYSFAHYSGGTY